MTSTRIPTDAELTAAIAAAPVTCVAVFLDCGCDAEAAPGTVLNPGDAFDCVDCEATTVMAAFPVIAVPVIA